MDLVELLNKAVELKASDVHITVNLSPIARINGKFQKLSQDLYIVDKLIFIIIFHTYIYIIVNNFYLYTITK